MKCNIDEKGRRVRRAGGVVCCVAGAALAIIFFANHYSYAILVVGLALLAAGVFQLFEARKGWCALRAMGMKTRV
jgi:uncharacterized membrane protein HdeD (DUF308 family)